MPTSIKPIVLVLMGGPDAEREVSLMSGREVAQALRQSGRFEVVEQVIDKPSVFELKAMIAAAPGGKVDVVFPVLHGRWGEGGPLQEELEQLGVPYVGSRPKPAALAMNKLATKAMLVAEKVPTPQAQELCPTDRCDIAPPLVLKPIDDGSSVDLRICRTVEQVETARRDLHPRRGRLMAETFIQGREVTAGIIMGQALPLIEIIPSKKVEFYDYQAKYFRDDTQYLVKPDLPPGITERCQAIALAAFHKLGCRDIARADMIVDDRGPWFLEINTMPGFTTHSLVPMAARTLGWEMPDLTARLALAALERGRGTSAATGAATQSMARCC